MDWFSGSINEAIARAKARGALFVVAVHGPKDSDDTKSYLSLLDSAGVGARLRDAGAVSIRVEGGSDLCRQFSAVYPVVVVPALYFIDASDGVNVEVAAGAAKTQEQLAASVEKALEFVKNKASKQASDASAAASVASPRGARVEAAQRTLGEAAEKEDPKEDQASGGGGQSLSLEERVARAKQLLAAKRAQKEEEEGQAERSKEQERREMGRAMQEQRRRREDDEVRSMADERRKDKEEEREARERVRRQIEQDRQERAAKWNQEKEKERKRAEEERRRKMEEEAKRADQERIASSSVARIQFRLPDGRSQMDRFDPDEPLEVLYRFVEDSVKPGFSRFSLSTTFPSRQLDSEDRGRTLRQLGLVPTATVLVLPAAAAGSRGGGDLLPAGQNILWMVLAPFTYLWGLISYFLFPPNPNAAQAAAASPDTAQPTQRAEPAEQSRGYSREGNIARLRRPGEGSDDETNTYNGNSTQQM